MKEHKEDVVKIILSGVLLAVAALITKVFFTDLPVWANILIYAVPYLIVGYEVIFESFSNIAHGKIFDECFLMSVATIGAFAIGEYPEAVFVMLFFSVGELFEHIASDRSRRSIGELMNIRPDTADVEINGEIKTVSPEEVKKGDIIVVKPGERIPLDGEVIFGESSEDTSALTGESLPRTLRVSNKAFGGCVNLTGLIKIRVESVYAESTVSRILELVEHSAEKKAKTEKFITKFSKVYTPVVVTLAVLLAIIPSIITGNPTRWLYSALTFLVVSCPCALVVSIPLSFFSGIGGASKRGVLIKGSDSLEALSKLENAVFDKSGTITRGNFEVTAVHPNIIDEKSLLKLAAAAESFSTHPISMSLKNACGEIPPQMTAENTEELSGKGVCATIGKKHILVGNGKLMKQFGIEYHDCHKQGTVVHIACDNEYYGHIIISDTVKPDSKTAIQSLKQNGVKTYMLTGDNEKTAAAVAKEVGIDSYRSELMPDGKVSCLEEIISDSTGATAFVGDGINDAPVLARADVGVAMGGLGSDAAIEAADIVIMNDSLAKLPLAVKIARKTMHIAKENTVFAMAVKLAVLVMSAFAVPGVMWLAAFADAGVLVLAVLNSMRSSQI